MAWTSNQGRSGGLTPLPGISPARLSITRERRVIAARTPWTPTQPATKSSSQGTSSNSVTNRTSNFTMSKDSCVKKLQAHAAPEQPLISQTVKDSGASVQLHFSSGFYSLVIQPVFSTLSKKYSLVIEGCTVSAPDNPIINRDQGGLLVDFQLKFSVSTPSGPIRTARLFLYPTTTSLQVQGGAKFSKEADSPTVAEWFISLFVLPKIESEVKKKKIGSAEVNQMNKAILSMRKVPPTQIVSLASLPTSSLQAGANLQSISAKCGKCYKKLDGRSANSTGFPECPQCKQFFHTRCLEEHSCEEESNGEESDKEDLDQDMSNTSLGFFSPPAKTPTPQQAYRPTPQAALTPGQDLPSAVRALTFITSPAPSSALSNLAPHMPTSVPNHLPPEEATVTSPPSPKPKRPSQNSRPKAGLAQTAGALDLEISQRALFLCKEELALKESELREASIKSNVFADRIRLLESEVTKMLAEKHLHTPSSPNTPCSPSSSTQLSPQCVKCDSVSSDLQEIKLQLNILTTTVHQKLKPPPFPSQLQKFPTPPPKPFIPAPMFGPSVQPGPSFLQFPPPPPHFNFPVQTPPVTAHYSLNTWATHPRSVPSARAKKLVPLMSLVIPRPPRLHPRPRRPHVRVRNNLFHTLSTSSESPIIENLASLN